MPTPFAVPDDIRDPRLAALLEQREWLARLAQSLVVDVAAADDLAPETLRVALERPPGDHAHPRAWLATVARQLARRIGLAGSNRSARERQAAQQEWQPATADVVARAELQHAVSSALLSLPEPYRTALLLRYIDDLPPRVIAKRTAAPVETVRTRLKRGVELMRARLTEARGAGGGGATVAAFMGALWMSTKLKLAATAVVLIGSSLATALLWSDPQPSLADAGATARERNAALATPVDVAAAPLAPAAMVEAMAATPANVRDVAAPPAPPAPPTTCDLTGIVVDARGAPVAGARILYDGDPDSLQFASMSELCRALPELPARAEALPAPPAGVPTAISAEDGTFRLEGLKSTPRGCLAAIHHEAGLAQLGGLPIDPQRPPAPVELVLADGVVLHGEVRDRAGEPLEAGVMVMQWRMDGDQRRREPVCTLKADPQGRYRSLPLPFRQLTLSAYAEGFNASHGKPITLDDDEREHRHDFVLERQTLLRGRIVLADGQPAPLTDVARPLLFTASQVEPFDGQAPPIGGETGLDREQSSYSSPSRHIEWVALWCGGALLGKTEVTTPGEGPDLVVDLGRIPQAALRGTLSLAVVAAEDGEPIESFELRLATPLLETGGAFVSPRRLATGGADRGADAASGRAEFGDLPLGNYELEVRAPGYATRLVAVTLDAARDRLPQRVELARPEAGISGRVVDTTGAPVANAAVDLLLPSGAVALPHPEFRVLTTLDGTFAFPSLARGDYLLVANPEQTIVAGKLAPAVARVTSGTADVTLALVPGVRVTVEALLPPGTMMLLFHARVVDATGLPVIGDRPGTTDYLFMGSRAELTLAPGNCTVELLAQGHRCDPVAFIAADGVRVQVEMTRLVK